MLARKNTFIGSITAVIQIVVCLAIGNPAHSLDAPLVPSENTSVLYIYRDDSFAGSGASTRVLIDGKQVLGHLSERSNVLPSTKVESSAPKLALEEITDAFTSIKQQNPGVVEDKTLADACLQGMLAGLDRQSAFLDEEDFRELKPGSVPPGVGGVGIEIGIETDLPKIVSSIEEGPAYRAGLKSGDLVVKIDNASTKGLSLKDVVRQLRGTVGSKITLTIEREGARGPLEFVLTREVIRIQTVKWRSVASGYAYIRISQFQEFTGLFLTRAIENAYRENQGDLKGLILDLRNNPGGLLNACVAVSAAFLPQGSLVVYTDGRTEDSKMRLTASPENYLRGRIREDYMRKLPSQVKTVPLAVLVNHKSAACSEIVAAALQDHKRAKILGVRTFGQGSVATIIPLKGNTALKLTTARFFRPNGQAIAANGVTPDVILEEASGALAPFGSAEDPVLTQAVTKLGDQTPTR